MLRTCLLVLTLLQLVAVAFRGRAAIAEELPVGLIWIEGEDATSRDVTQHDWYDSVKHDALSGRDWLSHFDPRREGTAKFEVEIDQAGEYQFWIRANPLAAKLSYRIDESIDWTQADLSRGQRGHANIASDNKPDLRFITWAKIGRLRLDAGKRVFAFRFHSNAQNHGGIDCFVLSRIPFIPSGTAKPSTQTQEAQPDDWFPVSMDYDSLSQESVIDVGHLIDAPAGASGFLKRDGSHLRFENSRHPSKFWGVGSPPQGRTQEEMDNAAGWFRKHGINIVRQHTVIGAVGLLDRDGRFDAGRLDRYDRWFATLKKHGIYSTWSVVYPHHGAFLRKSDIEAQLFEELDQEDKSRDGAKRPIVVNDYINLDRRIQAVVWRYFEALLTHVNPYTGLAYKDDPALAVVELQNESNLFFFTLNSLLESERAPAISRSMRHRFFKFVQSKYKTQAGAIAAWGQLREQDDWGGKELALMGAHHWGSDGPKFEYQGQERRCGDYIEFLTSIQREYYDRRIKQLRDIGFNGVTVTTAWKSGGPGASLANLYCDTAADCIDRHNYFGGGDGGHRIVEGKVNTASHLSQPGRGLLAVGMFQVDDRPFAVSEWSHLPPNPWKAEAAPLIAFYGMGLQGWDASYHFNMGDRRIGDGWPKQSKYASQTPHYIGQFPALAFAIHHGHIAEADIVARRSVSRNDIFAGRDVLGQSLAGGGYDAKELTGKLTTDPLSLAIGRVTIDFTGAANRLVADASQLHDSRRKRVRSNTGQLVWRYGDRVVEVRAEKTQAIIGFVGNEPIQLPDVSVETQTPFVSMIFTPLDNQALKHSKSILITAMARDRQTGSQYNKDWSLLTAEGRPPLLMEPVQATIRLSGGQPKRVRPLDLYGVPRNSDLPIANDGTFRIDGRAQTYYYQVLR